MITEKMMDFKNTTFIHHIKYLWVIRGKACYYIDFKIGEHIIVLLTFSLYLVLQTKIAMRKKEWKMHKQNHVQLIFRHILL